MSAQDENFHLIERWRELSEQESEAIRTHSWPWLHSLQRTKETLQVAITAARPESTPATRREWREMADRLIALERGNADALAEQLRSVTRQREELERSVRNLRQVRQSYASTAATPWQSYS